MLVYTEFARIDATGAVSAPAEPREILSPALVRNGFTSFQMVVQPLDEAAAWELYVAQNPDNAVEVTLYREAGNRLEKLTPPARGTGTQVFWMDVWTAKSAPVERIKIEPQLHVNNEWRIYPIEGRVMEATVPDGEMPTGVADAGSVMRGVVCGTPVSAGVAEGVTQESMRYRNAQQDRALAARAAKAALAERFGSCAAVPPADNPEWYLRVRDFLFRTP
jgi:hypothetical protein